MVTLLVGATFLAASPLRAQNRTAPVKVVPPLLAIAISDLSFGAVLPGIPASVSVRDRMRAGQFEIQGPADASVRIEFVLPKALRNGTGARLPIRFGPGDGFADFSHGHPPRGLRFDPHAPVIGTLGRNKRLFIWIGGTLLPERTQASGSYFATIAITVYGLGS